MQYREVLSKRTALKRVIGYPHKGKELAMYVCGLGDWVASMKKRGSSKTRLVPASLRDSDTPLPTRPRSHATLASNREVVHRKELTREGEDQELDDDLVDLERRK